jgi:hypothetical protein
MAHIYQIVLQDHLDADWSEELEGMTIIHQSDGTSLLADPLADQSALHGLLLKVRDLGLTWRPWSACRPIGHLVPPVIAWWGALTLLLLFVAGISSNLARGQHPNCHCFGQLHSAPAGWSKLIRNLGLSAIAGLVVIFGRGTPGLGIFDWLTALPMTQRIEVVAGLAVVALLVDRKLTAVLGALSKQKSHVLASFAAAKVS